jgi:hypothetical protein
VTLANKVLLALKVRKENKVLLVLLVLQFK